MWISRETGLRGGGRTSAPRWAEGTASWRHSPRHGPEETGPADSSRNPALTKQKALGRLREFPSISPLPGALWGNGGGKRQACVPLWEGIWTLQHPGQLPSCQVLSESRSLFASHLHHSYTGHTGLCLLCLPGRWWDALKKAA